MNNFLVKNSIPTLPEGGATFYTQEWLNGPSYSLPPDSKVQIVASHNNGNFEVIATDINIDYIYEDLLSDWEGPDGDYCYEYMSDDKWSEICWNEAEYREHEMQDEIYIAYPEDFMGEYDKPSNFLSTPPKEEVFAEAMTQTKTLRFHRLSKLLKEKTRDFLAKVSGFFKHTWDSIPDIKEVAIKYVDPVMADPKCYPIDYVTFTGDIGYKKS